MKRQAEQGDVDFITGDYLAGSTSPIIRTFRYIANQSQRSA